MSSENKNLSIGNWVALSKRGAKIHRDYHTYETFAFGAITGAALLPLSLPGAFLARVGVAAAGAGIGVGGLTQAAVGAAAGAGLLSFIDNYLENHPEAEAVGVIVNIQRRWWWEEGYDYQVQWLDASKSWHLGKYLRGVEPPQI